MAREIDLTIKLNEADREYLLARGREQQVYANDAQFSNDPEALSRALYIPGTAIDEAEGVPATPDPDDEEVEDEDADEEGEGEGDNYDTWTKEQLRDELISRNLDGRGNKAELTARLREDDQNENEEEDEYSEGEEPEDDNA